MARKKAPLCRRSQLSGPEFWRSETLPFIEARSIQDGRDLSYDKHFHETFSIGIVANGRSIYLNGRRKETIGAGEIVLMNPGDAHSCNPLRGEPWSYRMLYFDAAWFSAIQHEIGGHRSGEFQPFSAMSTRQRSLYAAVNRLYDVLTSSDQSHLEKHSAAIAFATQVHHSLASATTAFREQHFRLGRAHDFIRDNYTRSLKVEELCAASDLSPSYLIRAFKQKYGMTPHAYITNCRVEFCRAQLRLGRPIAEIAMAAGFSDQAHLQRTFKRWVAATPGQFQGKRY